MIAWILTVVIVGFLTIKYFEDWFGKKFRNNKLVKKNGGSDEVAETLSFILLVLMIFVPPFFIEYPRIPALVTGNYWMEGMPVSFENGVLTPHPWGAWSVSWAPRTRSLPSDRIYMGQLGSGGEGVSNRVRNPNIGWVVEAMHVSAYVDDHQTFYSTPGRQDFKPENKEVAKEIASVFLDALEAERDSRLGEVAKLSKKEFLEQSLSSEDLQTSAEITRRLAGSLNGVKIQVWRELKLAIR
ncbi:MAG: hypothetical protein NUW02_01850 [Candidatus Campbellbacteria bacterium]|nr:hypothetical protein [Candidatus Campbellbacteria bacterium]